MDKNLQSKINESYGFAKKYRDECEEMLLNGTDPDSAEYRDKFESAERAIRAAEGFKSLAEHRERDTAMEAWLDSGDDNAPVAPSTPLAVVRGDPTAADAYVKAFDSYINRYSRGVEGYLGHNELRTLTIAVDPDGGYTVPPDRREGILAQQPAMSEILGLITTFPTSRDIVTWTRVLPHAASPDIYTSAFVGGMVGEITGGGDAQPRFGTLDIPIKKARATARFSIDLASDSAIDMNEFLKSDGALNLALVRENQVLNGDGIGANCRGVLNDPDLVDVDVEGTAANTISYTAAPYDPGSIVKLMNLDYAIPAQYKRFPSFAYVMHPSTELAVRKLADASGRFIWQPGFSGEPNTMFNKRLVRSEFMPVEGVNARRVILAGPLSEIVSPERTQLSAQVLVERYADTDEIALVLRMRFGVGVRNIRAFRAGQV
jgi:HK97 family phage major capsid protein